MPALLSLSTQIGGEDANSEAEGCSGESTSTEVASEIPNRSLAQACATTPEAVAWVASDAPYPEAPQEMETGSEDVCSPTSPTVAPVVDALAI